MNIVGEEAHVTSVRIFKSDKPHSIDEVVRGFFVFQVTNHKTNRKIIGLKTKNQKSVKFDISRSRINQISLLPLIQSTVVASDLFSVLTNIVLAEEIRQKIQSRFSFLTTCANSDVIITVNIDRIYFGDGVSGSMSYSSSDYVNINDGDDKCGDVSGLDDSYDEIEGYSEVTGLAEVKLKNLEFESEDRCSICLEGYFSESGIAKAQTSVCCHMFHRDCILPWLQKFSNCCPLCRAVFIAQV